MAKVIFFNEEQYLLAKLEGEVTLLQSSEIKEEIKEQLTKLEQKNLILDLSGVPLLDSSGLGILISLFKYINQQQGKIVYVGATDYVKKIIGFAKLEQIFTLAPDLEQAKQIIYNK